MVTLKDMATGYVEQIKFRIEQEEQRLSELTNQLNELKQHLQECENEVEFGKGKRCCGSKEECADKSSDNTSEDPKP